MIYFNPPIIRGILLFLRDVANIVITEIYVFILYGERIANDMAVTRSKRANNHRASGASEDTSGFSGVLTGALKGTGIGVAAAFALMFIVSAVAYMNKDPDVLTTPLAFAALYLSCIIAGAAAVRSNGGGILPCGVLSGLFMLVLFMLISLFFPDSMSGGYSFGTSLGLRAAMVPASVAGGFIGLKRHSSKPRRHRR